MKVLSLTEPYATLIKEGYKKMKLEVLKQIIEGNFIYMLQKHQFQKDIKKERQ